MVKQHSTQQVRNRACTEKRRDKSHGKVPKEKGSCIFREKSLLIRELRAFGDGVVLIPGGAGEGVLGLFGRSWVPQSSCQSLLCFFSEASIL